MSLSIDLTGRTALVSGSTQGIGAAIAVELAADAARTEVDGASVHALVADLATAEGAAQAYETHPDVDVLVNNLGVYGSADPLEISDDEWRRYFEVNVLSAVRLIRTYLPGMTAAAGAG